MAGSTANIYYFRHAIYLASSREQKIVVKRARWEVAIGRIAPRNTRLSFYRWSQGATPYISVGSLSPLSGIFYLPREAAASSPTDQQTALEAWNSLVVLSDRWILTLWDLAKEKGRWWSWARITLVADADSDRARSYMKQRYYYEERQLTSGWWANTPIVCNWST